MATVKQKREAKNREEDAVAFYISQGWTPEQALGIVGNLLRESGLNPNAVGDGGKAFGLAQHHPDRQARAKKLYGDEWKTFENQLKFINWELNNTEKSAGDKLRASKGVWEAGRVVSDDFERPKVKYNADETRQQHVSDLAMRLKGIVVTPRQEEVNYANNVAPYLNPQTTTAVNQLQIPIISGNFAGVSDAQETEIEEKKDEQPIKEAEEVKQQTNEYNFLKNYQEQYTQQQEQQPIQIPTIDVEQTVSDVSQFVDADITAQQGRRPFKLQDERNLIQKDNTPNAKRDLSLMLAEYNNAKKDEQELRTTGQIKNPNSIQYSRNVKPQAEVRQDNISTEERNAQLSPLERPLIYLANPDKALGDLGVPGMETSELDRQAIAANRFNPNQTRTDRFLNQVKLGAGYVPEAAVNTAMAAAFMPEGSGALGLVNETLNPLAGIKTSIPDELRQGLRANGFSFEPKFNIKDDHFYRSIGIDGADDALSSGNIRSKQVGDYAGKNPYFVEGADFDKLYSTGSGATSNKPEYIFEMPMVDKSGEAMTANRVNQSSGYAPYVADKNQIPVSEGSIYKLNSKGEYEVFNTPNFDKIALQSMSPKNAQIIKSKYGEFTPQQLEMLKPVDLQSNLISPPKKTYRKVFDPTTGFGEFKKDILRKTDTPITSTKIAKQKALELSPDVFTHDSRMNVGMSTLTNKSDALNIYGIKEYKGAEYYPYTSNNINNFHNTETWLHHYKVNPDSKILNSEEYAAFNNNANKDSWTQIEKADYLKKLGYSGIKKWDNSPEIQFLNPQESLSLQKTKRISPNDMNRHQQGEIVKDQEGQRRFPNQPTEIQGNKMATDGYGEIPLYVIPDKGAPKIVMPNTGDHTFKGATKFTEYPITKEEQMFLEEYGKLQVAQQGLRKEYNIKSGDTLSQIAQNNRIPLSTLANVNNLNNPNLIKEGSRLIIPTKFNREVTFDEIPTTDNKKIIIDNYSKHYDYVVEGDKTFYKTKLGKTWADISDNTTARENLVKFIDKNNYWAGYGSGENIKSNKTPTTKEIKDSRTINDLLHIPDPSKLEWETTPIKEKVTKKVPIKSVVKNDPSFFSSMGSYIGDGLEKAAYQTDSVIKDIKESVEDGANKVINTTQDAYQTAINGIKRKYATHSGEDDDVKVPTTVAREDPLNVRDYYKTNSNVDISAVIDAPKAKGRQFKQQVLPTSAIKFGYRNRGDYNEIETDGLEVTTFNPFSDTPIAFKKGEKVTDNSSFLVLTPNGELQAGHYKDFKDKKGYKFSPTVSNKIVDFAQINGKNEYVSGEQSGNPGYQQPKIKVIDEKTGKIVDSTLNILVKDDSKKDFYGSIQGGRILLVNPTTKQQYLVSGSVEHIKEKFKEIKGNEKYLEAYTLDNGTYSRGLSYKDKKLTTDRLKSYDLENTSGGNGLYIKQYDKPVSEYPDEYINDMPNIRTKKDTSYKKGHKLRNDIKNIVLHHTAYTDPNAEQEIKKQYMTPNNNSSHIVIQTNGKRTIYASPEQVTFHAGESEWNGRKDVNDFSIGVEFQGDTNSKPLTDAQVKSFVEYYAPIAKKYKLSLKDVITHQMVAPGRKPDVTEKEYKRILNYMKTKGFK